MDVIYGVFLVGNFMFCGACPLSNLIELIIKLLARSRPSGGTEDFHADWQAVAEGSCMSGEDVENHGAEYRAGEVAVNPQCV